MAYIIKPLVTEKMTAITEKQNKFGFIVHPKANKIEIQKEVEAKYNSIDSDTINTDNTDKYSDCHDCRKMN